MRQRSTTTPIPEEKSFELTTKDISEEPREVKSTKVSDETLMTESNIISTIFSNTEPFTEMFTTTVNVPMSTAATVEDYVNTENVVTSFTENKIDNISATKAVSSVTQDISDTIGTTKAPTSTVTNVITSIYEAATERQRVRVKNIQNFLLEHKKTELVTKSAVGTATPLLATSPTTIENNIAVEEPTQKSILKGRLGQTHFRPTLRKPIGTSEKSISTEKIIETTTEKKAESTTEKKFRLNRYTNRFSRPFVSSTESTSTTGKRSFRPITENTLDASTRQFNRFRLTTTTNSDINGRRGFSRFRQSTSEEPLASSTELQKSRYFRSRRPIFSSSTSTTTTTEMTTLRETLNFEENVDNARYETTTYPPTTINFPTTANVFEETYINDEEFKTTTVDSFEPTKFSFNEITTSAPTTVKSPQIFRGSVRANDVVEYNSRSRLPSSGRQNSRFLKDEQKILFIRVMPSPDGRSLNEFTSHPVKNVTRNRGRIRAFDSLELNTLASGLTNEDRPNELFRGSETKFRVQQSTNIDSTEEV